MTPDEQKAVVSRYLDEAWNKGNLAVIDELMAPDYRRYTPAGILDRERQKQRIGAFHADLLEVPLCLTEAREALVLGRRLFGHGSVAVHPELGIYALLHSGADRDAFLSFAARMLDPLAAYDRKHKTDLLRTLQLYFEVGENVKEAAERLSVHRHTIFYRLNQIGQILKLDLKSPKDQLSVRAALAIRLMDAHEEPHE